MNEQIYDTAFVRRCATDECYRGELLSARDFDRWLTHTKAEALREAADEIAATAKRIRDAHGGAPSDVVGHILDGYGQAEGVVHARAETLGGVR